MTASGMLRAAETLAFRPEQRRSAGTIGKMTILGDVKIHLRLEYHAIVAIFG
jgi:hypothetical protein